MSGELNLRVREGEEGGAAAHETALVELLYNNPWSTHTAQLPDTQDQQGQWTSPGHACKFYGRGAKSHPQPY